MLGGGADLVRPHVSLLKHLNKNVIFERYIVDGTKTLNAVA
jgi:hypothetical protein